MLVAPAFENESGAPPRVRNNLNFCLSSSYIYTSHVHMLYHIKYIHRKRGRERFDPRHVLGGANELPAAMYVVLLY